MSGPGAEANEVRVGWRALFRRIDGLYANRENHLVIDREVVPVIFVPGFMGSRLRVPGEDKVWDPDHSFFYG